MGFIGSLVDVSKNSKKFKQWEKEDNNKKAQRDVLYQKTNLDQKTLEKAAAKGKVIMDVIDIMDTHSEEVAENVEESVIPAVASLPILSLFGLGFLGCKFGIEPLSEKYNKEIREFFSNNREIYNLRDILSKLKANENVSDEVKRLKFGNFFYAESVAALFDKKNIEIFKNAKDKDLQDIWKKLEPIYKKYNENQIIKNTPKQLIALGGAFAALSAIIFIGINVIGAKLQVNSSRIARWQSRQDLSDEKYFVQYTKEQVAQAEKNLQEKEQEQQKTKKSFLPFRGGLRTKQKHIGDEQGFFKSIGGILKDRKKYDDWKKEYNLEDRKVTRDLTEEELIEAQKDKELIQRITKQINNKAEDYSENMEVAANVLIGGTPFLGAGVAFGLSKIFDVFKINDKIKEKSFKKLLNEMSEENGEKLKDIFANIYKTVTKNGKKVQKLDMIEFAKKQDDIFDIISESMGDTKGIASFFKAAGKFTNFTLSTDKGVNILATIIGGLITGIAGSMIGLKLQKSAARAGRFKAKQEIQKDPQNFIGYTNKEYESVKDIEAQKPSFSKRVKDHILFIPNCIKDYFEYEKYKKTEGNKNKILREELVKLDSTKEQLQEAKELQRKIFTTFESVDDKSQEYSESMETANEISKPFLPYIGIATLVLPIGIAAIMSWRKGGAYIAEKITGFFAKHTKILKSKFFENYTDNVGMNIQRIVQEQDVNDFDFYTRNNRVLNMLKQLGVDEEKISDVMNFLKNNKNIDLKDIISSLNLKVNVSEEVMGAIEKINTKEDVTLRQSMGILINVLKKSDIDTTPQGTKLSDALIAMLKSEETSSRIPKNMLLSDLNLNINANLETVAQGVSKATKKALGGANKVTKSIIGGGLWRDFANSKFVPQKLRKVLSKLSTSKMTDKQAYEIYTNIETIVKNLPAEQTNKILSIAWSEFEKNPQKFIIALQNGNLSKIVATQDIMIASGVSAGIWGAISFLLNYTVESVFASMQKKAGRLGVMQGLEELKDDRFYADFEPKTKEVKEEQKLAVVPNKPMSPLLQKQLKK